MNTSAEKASAALVPPCDALRPWVIGYTLLENDAAGESALILPGLEPILGFQYRGRVLSLDGPDPSPLERSGITGLQSAARRYRYLPGTGTVLVRFKPWGAAAFLTAPMHELADRSVGLSSILAPASVLEVGERLAEAGSAGDRIRIVEAFLLSLRRDRVPDGILRRALRLLESPETSGSMGRISAEVGVGERQLERKFREWVGVGPKRYARLIRFQTLLRGMLSFPQRSAASLGGGYHDQAHLIREFRSFAGTTPEAFLRDLRSRAGGMSGIYNGSGPPPDILAP